MSFTIRVMDGNKPATTASVIVSGVGWLDGMYTLAHTGDGWYSTNAYSKSQGVVHVNGVNYDAKNNGTTIML